MAGNMSIRPINPRLQADAPAHPWINDYGQFSIMPVTGQPVFDEDKRASWFSHKGEIALPHYYKVYLAEHDVVTEFTPTEVPCCSVSHFRKMNILMSW